MKIKLKKNLCSGIFATIFGSVILWQIPYQILAKRSFATAAVGSDYLPRIMAMVLIVLGVMLLGQSLILKNDKTVELDLREEGRVLVAIAIMVAYVALTPRFGFLWTSIVANVLLLAFLRCRKWQYYLLVAALCAAVYFSFKYGMDVKLP